MNKKIKLKIYQIKKITYSLVWIASAFGLFFSFNFLYNNFYLAMTESSEIISLQKNNPLETINLDDFEKVLEKIENKANIKTDNSSNFKNPFN